MALAKALEPRSWAKVTQSYNTSSHSPLTVLNPMRRQNFRQIFRPTRQNLAAIFANVKRKNKNFPKNFFVL